MKLLGIINMGLAAALVLLSAPQTFAAGPAEAKIRVLIIDGCSNHDWKLTTRCIRAILEPTGLFDVTVSTSPASAAAPGWEEWRPRFRNHDVVVQTYNDLGGGAPWPAAVKSDFESFVREGGGLFVWHAGNNAFPDWPEYDRMIGLGWRKKNQGIAIQVDENENLIRIPAGEGRDTGHGPRFDALVTRLRDHPIHQGLPRRWRAANIEVYNFPRGAASEVEVLSYAKDSSQTKLNWPIEWVVSHGKGRVYTSTFGHVWKGDVQPVTVRDAGVQTLFVRALQWLAARPVTYPVPTDFPGETATSIRGELNLPEPN
ncbi:MAG TPA: ThuA domain-containing protein [Verrucomicrobiae bacterium]|nr:ThuA domain-containing protein [Verrucomicrobiae bacterium]